MARGVFLPLAYSMCLYLQHSRGGSVTVILDRVVRHHPQAEVLRLMSADEKCLEGNIPAAQLLAFVMNPEGEQIWLASVKPEGENGELGAAMELLVRARTVHEIKRVHIIHKPPNYVAKLRLI